MVPLVQVEEVPGRSKRAEPIRTDLKPRSVWVRLKQYPIKLEAKMELAPLTQKSLKCGLF